MKATELLAQVKIASPCHARWEDMSGDDRSRFCGQCQKHVYNFSAMTAKEVAELIEAKEGKLCGRYYRRRDGTMLTANCPVGALKYLRRLQLLFATTAGLFFTSWGIEAWSRGETKYPAENRFARKCDELLWTVKGWLGVQPPVAGMISVVPPPPPPPPPGANSGGNGENSQPAPLN